MILSVFPAISALLSKNNSHTCTSNFSSGHIKKGKKKKRGEKKCVTLILITFYLLHYFHIVTISTCNQYNHVLSDFASLFGNPVFKITAEFMLHTSIQTDHVRDARWPVWCHCGARGAGAHTPAAPGPPCSSCFLALPSPLGQRCLLWGDCVFAQEFLKEVQ